MARLEAKSGVISAEKIFGRHTARETNNTYQGAHASEWVCDRTIVELNSLYEVPYTPCYYLKGLHDTTGRAGDLVVDECMIG